MCEFIIAQFVSAVVGLVVGAVVSAFFYFVGRRDAEKSAALVQINGVLLRIKQLAPMRWEDVKAGDGVESTSHWLKCTSEVAAENGHGKLAREISVISDDMRHRLEAGGYNLDEEWQAKKREWESRLRALRDNPTAL